MNTETGSLFQPVRALSMMGLFPGFARPHFLQVNESEGGLRPNTFYVQQVHKGRIAGFDVFHGEKPADPLVCEPVGAFDPVSVGDPYLYAYAFSQGDAHIGTREHIMNMIASRFGEIETKVFAARAAAGFAQLFDRLAELNRKALEKMRMLSPDAAHLWRDSSVFLPCLREVFEVQGIAPPMLKLETTSQGSKLVVDVGLGDAGTTSAEGLQHLAEASLRKTGLFAQDDVVRIRLLPHSRDEDGVMSDQTERHRTNPLDRAKAFLEENVFGPIMLDKSSSKRLKDSVRSTQVRISHFRKIGDLVRYVDRFRPSLQQVLPFPPSAAHKLRLEDVHAGFMEKFSRYGDQITSFEDFREGSSYNSFALSIYTQSYDNRSGGIRPVGKLGEHRAVVVTLTMAGGKYANEWIEPGKRLKCYLKRYRISKTDKTRESHDANRAILDFPGLPILVFIRDVERTDFIYGGVFRFSKVVADQNGARWMELIKSEAAA